MLPDAIQIAVRVLKNVRACITNDLTIAKLRKNPKFSVHTLDDPTYEKLSI